MAKKITSILYDMARTIGKVASVTNDLEDISNGNFGKLIKRKARRVTYNQANKVARKVNNKIGL